MQHGHMNVKFQDLYTYITKGTLCNKCAKKYKEKRLSSPSCDSNKAASFVTRGFCL